MTRPCEENEEALIGVRLLAGNGEKVDDEDDMRR